MITERKIAIAAVRNNGLALEFASKDLRADHEVVLTAVQQNGIALQDASKDLCADHEIVLAAVQRNALALQFANETLRQDEQFVADLADVCSQGYIWFYEPQLSLEETARKAMRSKDGLLLLVKQARVSLLGETAIMKELLLSALEQGCLKETLRTLIAKQKKGILNALRTVMAWYGVDVPTDTLPNEENAGNVSDLLASAIVKIT